MFLSSALDTTTGTFVPPPASIAPGDDALSRFVRNVQAGDPTTLAMLGLGLLALVALLRR